MLDGDSVKSVKHEIKGQVGGFENHNAWVQAVPSFPSPTPSFLFLLSPHFSRGQNVESSFLLRSLLHGNVCYAG